MPSPEDAETIQAHVKAADQVAIEHEAKWGVGRLPLLVGPDLAAKFARQGLRYRNALEEGWTAKMLTQDQLATVVSSAAGMARAWQALDGAASEAGARPLVPDVWEAEMSDGSVLAVVRSNMDAHAVLAQGRHVNVWTLEEIVRAVEHMPEAIQATKKAFPGAQVLPAKERYRGKLNDDLPF